MRAMYANGKCNVCERGQDGGCDVCQRQVRAMYASNRSHDEDIKVDNDKRQVFITTR